MNEWWLLGLLVALTVLTSVAVIYPFRRQAWVSFFLMSFMFTFVSMGYYYWGGFASWQKFRHQNESKALVQQMLKTINSPQELIDKLRAKLDDSPKSAKGWFLLGRLYSSQKDNPNALKAFTKAYQFQPDEDEFAVNYAHSLWQENNQQFTPHIKKIFHALLIKNPNQPDALSMLAMDAFVSHAYDDAITYWQRLLLLAPSKSEEAKAIRKAIAKAQGHLNLRPKDNK